MKYLFVFSIMLPTVSWGQMLKLDPYLKLQEALASDDLKAAEAAHFEVCQQNLKKTSYRDCGKKFKDIEDLRTSFKVLSFNYASRITPKEMNSVIIATCPMAKATWLQRAGGIRNPYYGKSMLECGEQVKTMVVEPVKK